MTIRNFLPAFAATILILLAQSLPGWAENYRTQSEKNGTVYRSDIQQPDEDYDSQPQLRTAYFEEGNNRHADACINTSYNMHRQQIIEDDGEYNDHCSNACSRMCYSAQPPRASCGECDDACTDPCCIRCPCIHKKVFAEYLFLRPENASVEYAVPVNGPISAGAVPIEIGRTAAVEPDFSSGIRVGGAIWLDDCASISATFTHYENSADDAIAIDVPFVINSLVTHPSTLDAGAQWLNASAHQFIKFDFGDLDYRREIVSNECTSINYLVGIRYANLKQDFNSLFEPTIAETVNTQIKFEGGGLRLGLEAQRNATRRFFGYAKGSASFLGGEFRASYLQSSVNDPVLVQTDWKEARFISILDCEVGVGWKSCDGRLRASAGYMLDSWLNIVKTAEFISSVQANHYHGPDKINGNGLVFDGLVAKIEYDW